MATGFRESVDAVRRAADIADVVGETVALRRAGRSLTGLCPFHHEKTPSFHVDPAKQLYYCFGCGAGGDVFKFVMEIHGVEFSDAVGLLADRYGIPRPSQRDGADAADDRRRRRMLAALEAAQSFFVETLAGPQGTEARAYVAKRGLEPAAVGGFGIGLAPSAWDGLHRNLVGKGFDTRDLVDAGLAVPRRAGDGVYDRFRHRLTFPIRDSAGRVVSFGGRALGDDDPKYLNGPETAIFDKARTLFRLSDAAREIRSAGRAVVVEGYFDAISLATVGVPGVVAVCGTALSDGHARILRRWTESVTLLFDGDQAGRRAAHRALEPLLSAGLMVRIATPPDGKDPDDLAREGGLDAVSAVIDAAKDITDFMIEESRRRFDVRTTDGRVKALELALAQIAHFESPVARSEASRRLADGFGIDDDLVREEVRRAARARETSLRPGAAEPRRTQGAALGSAERTLVRFLGGTVDPGAEALTRLLTHIPEGGLSALGASMIERWSAAYQRGSRWTFRELTDAMAEPARTTLLEMAFSGEPEPTLEDAWAAISAMKQGSLRVRLAELQKRIESARDPEMIEKLMVEKLDVAKAVQALAAGGGLDTR